MIICKDRTSTGGCGATNANDALRCWRCAMALHNALRLHDPGTNIGHYRIQDIIGYGGDGGVYSAEDLDQPEQHVALKATLDPISIGSLRHKFGMLPHLKNQHLPCYHEIFEEANQGYLVMELVRGQSLEFLLEQQAGKPLNQQHVLHYALQLCSALDYLHSQQPPFVHGDVKPSNIRLTSGGVVKLVDLGLPRKSVDDRGNSRRGLLPAYAALELWEPKGQPPLPQSDIYSLGATLYHLLTGQKPPTAQHRMTAHTSLPSPHEINSNVSPQVSEAIMQALALDVEERYTNIPTFKLALMGISKPVSLPPRRTSPTDAPYNDPRVIPVPALRPVAPVPTSRPVTRSTGGTPTAPPLPQPIPDPPLPRASRTITHYLQSFMLWFLFGILIGFGGGIGGGALSSLGFVLFGLNGSLIAGMIGFGGGSWLGIQVVEGLTRDVLDDHWEEGSLAIILGVLVGGVAGGVVGWGAMDVLIGLLY